MKTTFRPERADDTAAIASVVAAAFGSSAEAELVVRIRDSDRYVAAWALVATIGDEIVGHAMVSWTDLINDSQTRRIPMLSPLAVAPSHQGNGIGGGLVNNVCERVDGAGEPLIVLEGSPIYYARHGFEAAGPHGIELPIPDWALPEAGQVRRLRSYSPEIRGRVVYPAAFDDLPH